MFKCSKVVAFNFNDDFVEDIMTNDEETVRFRINGTIGEKTTFYNFSLIRVSIYFYKEFLKINLIL